VHTLDGRNGRVIEFGERNITSRVKAQWATARLERINDLLIQLQDYRGGEGGSTGHSQRFADNSRSKRVSEKRSDQWKEKIWARSMGKRQREA